MRLLIVGNGGRASALALKLSEDSRITKMFFAPGNATTEKLGENINETDIIVLRDFAIKNKVDLTIVGPEKPLVEGIVDEFKKVDLKVFGPAKKAASLEGSKAFSKKFMKTYGIKTAESVTFDSYADAKEYLQNQTFPIVIKASGLAGGKGVVIADNSIRATEKTVAITVITVRADIITKDTIIINLVLILRRLKKPNLSLVILSPDTFF